MLLDYGAVYDNDSSEIDLWYSFEQINNDDHQYDISERVCSIMLSAIKIMMLICW